MKGNRIFESPVLRTKIKSEQVKIPEMLFGYLIGPIGALLSGGIFTSFINYYFTDVLFAGQLTAAVQSFLTWLPAVSAVFIVLGNLVAGQLIERTRTKAGKARPWILLSAVTLTVACLGMFFVPVEGAAGKMVWVAAAYNLYYSVAYPIYNTANSTLIPVSTRDGSARSLLATFANVASLAVMGAGSMVFPVISASVLCDRQSRWLLAFAVIAVITGSCSLLQYFFTRERVTEETLGRESARERISMGKQVKAVTGDRSWWIIIMFYLLFQLSGGIKNLSMVYFCSSVLSDTTGGIQSLLAILGAVPMAAASLLCWPVSQKIGRKNLTFLGLLLGVAGGVIAYAGGDSLAPVAIGVALKCLGSSPACYLILAMISDTIDHIEEKEGFRCDGLTMSIYSSIMVGVTPAATGIFNAVTNAGTNVPAVRVCYILVETVAYGVCAALILGFRAEEKQESTAGGSDTLQS